MQCNSIRPAVVLSKDPDPDADVVILGDPPELPNTQDVIQQMLQAGWEFGTPPRVPDWAWKIDRATCRRARCPRCNRRGLTFNPYHKGDRYRVLGTCPDASCGGVESF